MILAKLENLLNGKSESIGSVKLSFIFSSPCHKIISILLRKITLINFCIAFSLSRSSSFSVIEQSMQNIVLIINSEPLDLLNIYCQYEFFSQFNSGCLQYFFSQKVMMILIQCTKHAQFGLRCSSSLSDQIMSINHYMLSSPPHWQINLYKPIVIKAYFL